MLKRATGNTIRATLLLSLAFYDLAPASAALLNTPHPSVSETGTSIPAGDELKLILAALDGPNRQTVDHPGRDPGKDGHSQTHNDDKDRAYHEIRLSRPATDKIVQDLLSVRKECSAYDDVYRIDCLRQGIDMIVTSIPDNSEYRDAKRILKKASARLGRIVAKYQDRDAPKLVAPAGANPRFRKTRRYTAIHKEDVPGAMAEASKVVNEATTELLRSGENSERRYAHYQEISVAVDSTKVLLRSS